MNDINNPLEEIKVKAVLSSKIRKLDFRKNFKPEDVNILDYTVIAALEKQVPRHPYIESVTQNGGVIDVLCPSCYHEIFRCFNVNTPWNDSQKSHKHCEKCGQKLDWRREE